MTALMYAHDYDNGTEVVKIMLASGRVDLELEKILPNTSLDRAIGRRANLILEALLTHTPYKSSDIAPQLPSIEPPTNVIVNDTGDSYDFKVDRERFERSGIYFPAEGAERKDVRWILPDAPPSCPSGSSANDEALGPD
jgi:hypothetical protein